MVSLRSSTTINEKLNSFLKLYSVHRPVIQRALNVFFIVYVLGASYTGLASRVGKGRSKKDKRKGKSDRVAVRLAVINYSPSFTKI
jgi:ATP-binding cassette subfamily D (ALD) long-chain fatty acid import protein